MSTPLRPRSPCRRSNSSIITSSTTGSTPTPTKRSGRRCVNSAMLSLATRVRRCSDLTLHSEPDRRAGEDENLDVDPVLVHEADPPLVLVQVRALRAQRASSAPALTSDEGVDQGHREDVGVGVDRACVVAVGRGEWASPVDVSRGSEPTVGLGRRGPARRNLHTSPPAAGVTPGIGDAPTWLM